MNGFADTIDTEDSSSLLGEEPQKTGPRKVQEWHATQSQQPSSAPIAPARPWFATESQRVGLHCLNALGDLFARVGDRAPGGFRPLLRPLVIGETGTGKSTLVREFARGRDWDFLAVDAGAWIIHGAYTKPATLRVIRDHVRSAARTCVFIDEACKLLPGTKDANSGWYTGVFAEFLALADGQERLISHEWTEDDIQKYQETCFLVCGGAFTDALKEARLCGQRGGLGFTRGSIVAATHSSKVAEYLPDEIFSRFNGEHIILQDPTRQDYSRGIESIHADLGIERTAPIKELLDEAEACGSGVRWLTDYVTRILLENPEVLRVQPAEEVPRPKGESFDFFTLESGHYAREITAHSFELRAALGRLYAEIQLRRNAITKSRDAFFEAFILSQDEKGLLALLRAAIEVSNAFTNARMSSLDTPSTMISMVSAVRKALALDPSLAKNVMNSIARCRGLPKSGI